MAIQKINEIIKTEHRSSLNRPSRFTNAPPPLMSLHSGVASVVSIFSTCELQIKSLLLTHFHWIGKNLRRYRKCSWRFRIKRPHHRRWRGKFIVHTRWNWSYGNFEGSRISVYRSCVRNWITWTSSSLHRVSLQKKIQISLLTIWK